MLKGDDFHKSVYLIGRVREKDSLEVISPAPEIIAEYIMKNKNDSVILTNEHNDVLLSAKNGIVTRCIDTVFLENELQPAIDNYEEYKIRWEKIYKNVFEDTEAKVSQGTIISDERARKIMESALSHLSDLQKGSELYFTLKECLDMTNEEMEIEGFTLENYYDDEENDDEEDF